MTVRYNRGMSAVMIAAAVLSFVMSIESRGAVALSGIMALVLGISMLFRDFFVIDEESVTFLALVGPAKKVYPLKPPNPIRVVKGRVEIANTKGWKPIRMVRLVCRREDWNALCRRYSGDSVVSGAYPKG